jgi:hypothetical protein
MSKPKPVPKLKKDPKLRTKDIWSSILERRIKIISRNGLTKAQDRQVATAAKLTIQYTADPADPAAGANKLSEPAKKKKANYRAFLLKLHGKTRVYECVMVWAAACGKANALNLRREEKDKLLDKFMDNIQLFKDDTIVNLTRKAFWDGLFSIHLIYPC